MAKKVILDSEPTSSSQSLPPLEAAKMVQGQEPPDSSTSDALTPPRVIDAERMAKLGYSTLFTRGLFNEETAMDGMGQQKKKRRWMKRLLCF
ncbi:hypothetical protein B0H11DRAFT_2254182 [Mycena galericulata]|nr:hypothetical protein B0H11DRAFT_2254182 [Mycena galericulata]